MSSLRSNLIRLAYTNPVFRVHLLPLLRKAALRLEEKDKDNFLESLVHLEDSIGIRDIPAMKHHWLALMRAGKLVSQWVVTTRSLPSGKETRVEAITKAFSAFSTNNIISWWERNQEGLNLLLEALEWPERVEGGGGAYQEIIPIPPLRLHNTVHWSGENLKALVYWADHGIRKLQSHPTLAKVLYGDVYLVGQLRRTRTLAWYSVAQDEVFIKAETRYGLADLHSLWHELGHRYWHRFLQPDQRIAWTHQYDFARFAGAALPKLEPGTKLPVRVRGYPNGVVVEKVVGGSVYVQEGFSLKLQAVLDHLKKLQKFPTTYASTSSEEYFAECFALYVSGDLGDPHKSALESVF
jgi:hypothetical protein